MQFAVLQSVRGLVVAAAGARHVQATAGLGREGRVKPEAHAHPVHLRRQRGHPARELPRNRHLLPGCVALHRGPPVVQVDVAPARVLQAELDHGLGRLDHEVLVGEAYVAAADVTGCGPRRLVSQEWAEAESCRGRCLAAASARLAARLTVEPHHWEWEALCGQRSG